MNKKEVISRNQFVWMLFILITSFATLQMVGMLIFHAGKDAWLSVIIAWFLDTMLAIIYAYMALRFPDQNMIQYSISILGKFFGRIVGLAFCLFFLMTASILIRSISMMFSNIILPNTPISVVIFAAYILVAYAVKKGIEVIGRVCEILGPIYGLSILLLFMLVFPIAKANRLKPQLAYGFYPFLSGSIFILAYIGICIIMGMYIPVCNRKEDGFITKFISVSMGSFAICLLILLSVGVFGSEQAGNMANVGFQLTKMIDIGDFIQRVEIIWIIIAIGAGIMAVANLIWASSLGISQVFNMDTYKPIVYPITLIALTLSITSFDSNVDLLNFDYYSYPFIGIFVETGLEIFLFVMALILKKKGPMNK